MRQVCILLGEFDAAFVEVPSGVVLLVLEVFLRYDTIFNFILFYGMNVQSWIGFALGSSQRNELVRLMIGQNASIHQFDAFLLLEFYAIWRIVETRISNRVWIFPVHGKSRISIERHSKIGILLGFNLKWRHSSSKITLIIYNFDILWSFIIILRMYGTRRIDL